MCKCQEQCLGHRKHCPTLISPYYTYPVSQSSSPMGLCPLPWTRHDASLQVSCPCSQNSPISGPLLFPSGPKASNALIHSTYAGVFSIHLAKFISSIPEHPTFPQTLFGLSNKHGSYLQGSLMPRIIKVSLFSSSSFSPTANGLHTTHNSSEDSSELIISIQVQGPCRIENIKNDSGMIVGIHYCCHFGSFKR